jgi:N-acetyl-alpha-D-glucosaminyl L-malate synthase BshA
LARGISDTPYVVTLHGSDVTILGSDPAYKTANAYAVGEADAITAVSRFMAVEAEERLGIRKPINVIPNFVDESRFSPAPERVLSVREDRGLVVIHVSNFRPVKRIQDLIHAMDIVNKEVSGARLMLVGDGPERHRIERLVSDLGLDEVVLMTGFRSDIPDLLRCSDVAVLCSETESAPLTLLEALSSGLPVIATRVGGIPEIIEDGVNGFLVPAKDPKSIAERLLALNGDKELRAGLGARARETVLDRYTVEKVIGEYLKIFSEIARG